MQALTDKRILLGISGGIAAYKSADLARRLGEAGAQVQVVMTPAATTFITPLTLQAVSGRAVRMDLLDPEAEAGMGHIELARWADLILIAPASADFIARLAHGLADDLLSTLCLATDKPLVVAPAMNRLMWQNPATQDNCTILERRGIRLWGPGSGEQACREVGFGRMLEPLELRDRVIGFFRNEGALRGLRVLITAGPTREPIDPVRFISNRSSGKMGFAVAAAAAEAGARVALVTGAVNLTTPSGVERIDVESAEEMHGAVMSRAREADIFVATAAVSDYRAAQRTDRKIKKTEQQRLGIELERNPDILYEVAALEDGPFTVGFAAETHDVVDYAREKLRRKKLDMIAANEVGGGRGFESERNTLHVLWEGGEKELPLTDKTRLGRELIALIAERYHAQHPA